MIRTNGIDHRDASNMPDIEKLEPSTFDSSDSKRARPWAMGSVPKLRIPTEGSRWLDDIDILNFNSTMGNESDILTRSESSVAPDRMRRSRACGDSHCAGPT